MKRLFCELLILIWFLPSSLNAEPKSTASIALTHVTVVDTRGGPSASDMTVIISGDSITDITKSADARLPKTAQTIDARGKFLIPGLWDMHVHMFLSGADFGDTTPNLGRDLTLFLANGVTGVRDTGAAREYFSSYIESKRRGETPARLDVFPRIVAAGQIIDGEPPYIRGAMIAVKDADEARKAVDFDRQQGADFIKVYSYMSRDAYFAVASETKKLSLTLAGHVPYAISAGEASDAGQKSFEHADGLLIAASSEEQEIRKSILDKALRSHDSELAAYELYWIDEYYRPIRSYSEAKAATLFAKLVRNGTFVDPTLIIARALILRDEEQRTGDLTARYWSAATRDAWRKFMQEVEWPADDVPKVKEAYARMLPLMLDLQRAGVGLLSGTDEGVAFVVPGFSLHEELAIFVEAGLTPLQALQTSTLNPARYFHREHELGTVEKGKLADLVLLDADPLLDIHNTRKINAVVANGTYLSRASLDKLLSDLATAVKEGK
jgi:predicted amidohydrolase